MLNRTLLLACALLVLSYPVMVSAQNLLANGDFNAGNSGFLSGYNYLNDIQGEDTYIVGFNPNDHHPGGASFPDHTTGTGKMLIVNASRNPDTTVWQQTVNVTPHTTYRLKSWGASWGNDGGFDPSPAHLRFSINSTPLTSDLLLPRLSGQWVELSEVWNSGSANTATIRVVNLNINSGGNDFVLDDMEFAPVSNVPDPVTISGIIVLQATFNSAQPISFTFRQPASSDFTRTATLNPAGAYTLSDIPAGEYTVSIKGAKWLRRNITVDARFGSVSNVNAQLMAGDANNDNFADISDLLLLIAAYNKVSPASGYSEAADFNCDGTNDINDLLLLIGNYNKQGDS